MESEQLSSISGIALFPVISMVLFLTFFVATLIWVYRLDKGYLTRMEKLPLDSNGDINNNNEI